MQLVVKFTFFLLLSKYSLTENTVKIKDILRNSSKMNNKNKTDEYETVQNENGDIFRNEMLKNFRQCVSNDSGNGENDYDENSDTFQRKGKNQYNKSYQSDKPYGYGGNQRNVSGRNTHNKNNNNDNRSNKYHRDIRNYQDNIYRNAYGDNKNCDNDNSQDGSYSNNYHANENNNKNNKNRFEYNLHSSNNRNNNRDSNCQPDSYRDNEGYNYEQITKYGNRRDYSQGQETDYQKTDYRYSNNGNYYNTEFNRRYLQRMKRENGNRNLDNQCISQCVFGFMVVLDDDQIPSETLVIKWVQEHVTNDDMKRIQTLREIRKCFARLSASDIDDGCEFSKELTKCLNFNME